MTLRSKVTCSLTEPARRPWEGFLVFLMILFVYTDLLESFRLFLFLGLLSVLGMGI